MRRAYLVSDRPSHNLGRNSIYHFGWAVTLFPVTGCAVDLHELSEVYAVTEQHLVLPLTTAQTAEALDLSRESVVRRLSHARFELCDALALKIVDRKGVGSSLNRTNAT